MYIDWTDIYNYGGGGDGLGITFDAAPMPTTQSTPLDPAYQIRGA